MTVERENRIEIPVLALRDVVVYPHMVIPLFVGREKSIRCLEAAPPRGQNHVFFYNNPLVGRRCFAHTGATGAS